jgi:hypothetical protein
MTTTDDQVRAGRREANLRILNERIADANAQLTGASPTDALRLVCECALGSCESTIDVSVESFDGVRSDPQRFIVCDGHVIHDVEHVVERGDGWIVVEKQGAAARAARRVLE